jgi:DNA-binding HxlR family transcriptional regulator
MALLDLLGRRWALRIIWELHLSDPTPLTFRALQQRCDDMSPSVLNQRLGELREAQLVAVLPAGYALSPDGTGLVTHLRPLTAWAGDWAKHLAEPAVEAGPRKVD